MTRTRATTNDEARKTTTKTSNGNAGLTGSKEAKRQAAAILEVLSGLRKPIEASEALGITLPRYYAKEAKALQGLITALEPRPRKHRRSPEVVVTELKRENERLQRELARSMALVRAAQRSMGLSSISTTRSTKKVKGKRNRRPVVRARKTVAALRKSLDVEPPTEVNVQPTAAD